MTTALLSLPIVNVLAYLLNVILTNGIGAMGWWDLPSNADLSNKYQTIVTPAGWAFAIWGIIYLSQLVWVMWQLPSARLRTDDLHPQVQAVQYSYQYVCLAQVGWTLSFSFEYIGLSLVFMSLLLFLLLRIVIRLQPYSEDYLLYKFPFSIHAAWILAATAVNFNVVLVWALTPTLVQFCIGLVSEIVLLLVVLGLIWKSERADLTFPLVLVWALLGIYSELSNPRESIEQRFTSSEINRVKFGALVGVVLLLASVVAKAVGMLRHRPSAQQSEEATYLRAQK